MIAALSRWRPARYHYGKVLHAIITRFGLPAVFLGSGVEGEPFALAGGLLAHRALVPLWAAIAAAVAGAFAIDLFWFTIGRRCRAHRWVRRAAARPAFARALERVDRHATLAVLLFRFAYGLRAVAPVAVGTSRLPAWKFVLLSFVAAVLWGGAFTLIGYVFGQAVSPWTADFAIFGALLGAVLIVGTVVELTRSGPAPPR